MRRTAFRRTSGSRCGSASCGWKQASEATPSPQHACTTHPTAWTSTQTGWEGAWHLARIREFPGRSILLSHHPLFSAFRQLRPREPDGGLSPLNQALLDDLGPVLAEGRIAAWFWGHEHRLAIYQPYAGLQRGRCVGNGAIPVAVSDDPVRLPDRMVDAPRLLPGITPGRDGPIYAHGCALLDLGAEARVEFYQTTQSSPLCGERLDGGVDPTGSPPSLNNV